MKKLIFSAAVLASAFFAASCQQEMLDPQAEGTTVTYTVEVPDAIATKATGDGFTLHYEVYRQGDLSNLDADPIYEGTKVFSGGKADVQLEFVKDQEFTVLFWAQKGTPQAYDITDLREVSLGTLVANDTTAEVFAGNDHVVDCKSDKDGNVVLVRPVAQLNIATTADSFTLGNAGSTTATVKPTQSKVVVNGLYGTYNVADGTVDTKASRTYTEYAVPRTPFKEGTYELMATNYLGFIPQAGDNVEVKFTIYTEKDGNIEHTVSNVPVKANYQTNILGNLISATADYQVTLEDWADAGKDMEVLADGIVKNINGDYEISTAKGLAYAICNVFANGGTFYVLKNIDMTGVSYDPADVPAGTTVHIVGETPVVTRSTGSVEITGLTKPLLKTVQNGAAASFANIYIDAPIDFVQTNNGVVAFNNCDNTATDSEDDLVGDNTNGTIAEEGTDINNLALEEALAAKASSIKLAGDITASEIIVVDYPVTIDGCGHKLTSSAGRAINVSGADGVTIKNLVINCSGERAINIIQNSDNVTIDNVTATAANYTVNVAGSAPGAVVNIENSTLNGLCTVNVSAESANVTVDNSTINCNDNNTTAGEAYSALSLNREAVGGKIIATNTVVNVAEGSDSHKGRNGAENGEVTINGSTDEVVVMVAAIIYPNSTYYHAFDSLDGAIDYAQESEGIVTLIRNLNVAETITIEEGQTVVLDLNGKTLAAADMNVIKNNGGNLTIKNGTVTRTGDVVGYSVNNASGEIVIDNATIQRGLYTSGSKMTATNANISHEQSSRHAIYAWNCEVTIHSGIFHNDNAGNATLMASGSSVVTINGGTFSIADGRSSLGWTSSMIDQNSTAQVLVKGGLFNGGFRINSADTKLTIEDGEFNTNNGSGFTDYSGTKVVKGGKFTDEGAQNWAKKYIAEGFKMNAYGEVVEKDYVAQVGDKKYESLQEAFATVQDDQTITFLSNVEQADGVILTDKNITVDLNGKTFTVSEGASTNNRNFKINGSSKVTIKNGTMIAAGELTSGAYGTVRTEGEAVVNLEAVKLYSYRGYGLNVKANTGTKVNIKDSEIYSQYSGGVEAAGGEIELTNVKIEQSGVYSGAAWCSVAIGVNGGGKVTVNSGDYYAAAIATDTNAAQATWVAYVMSSGGTLDIKGGTFTGVVAETASAANACGLICADRAAVVNIHDGIFNSNGAILDMRNNVGTQPNPVATLYGGNFSADPRVSGLYSSNLIKVAEGKEVVEGADGRWTIQ